MHINSTADIFSPIMKRIKKRENYEIRIRERNTVRIKKKMKRGKECRGLIVSNRKTVSGREQCKSKCCHKRTRNATRCVKSEQYPLGFFEQEVQNTMFSGQLHGCSPAPNLTQRNLT